MSRVLIGSAVAAIVLYIWGFIFWGVSPLPYSALSRTPDDAAAGQALLEHFPQTGTYYVPGPHNPPETLQALHEAGPLAMVFFHREGKPMMSPIAMLQGLVHTLVFAFIVAVALSFLGDAFPSYSGRVKLVAVMGVASAIWGPVANLIWWSAPLAWQLWIMLYDVVSWLLAGLVLAHFVPRTNIRE